MKEALETHEGYVRAEVTGDTDKAETLSKRMVELNRLIMEIDKS